jgi:intergrase/recombinase
MRLLQNTLAVAALTVSFASLSVTGAEAFSEKVRKACAGDYQNFCAQYIPESNEVRRCFESNRKGLTKICISALVDAGEVPAKYLKK